MRRWLMISATLGAALLAANLASAQSNRDRDRDDNGDRSASNYALAVGVGLVEPSGQTENYYMAALRIRLNRADEDNGGGGGGGRDRGIQGYLEPEIGYWKSTDRLIKGSDTLLGINLIGAFPFASAETFLGAGVGAHFVDADVLRSDASLTGSQTKLGANAQFGIDLHITRALTVFGTGRFDLVQGAKDNVQSKIYLGLRAHL